MCVDTGVRAAFDLGFHCRLVADACATRDLEHEGRTVAAADVQAAYVAAWGRCSHGCPRPLISTYCENGGSVHVPQTRSCRPLGRIDSGGLLSGCLPKTKDWVHPQMADPRKEDRLFEEDTAFCEGKIGAQVQGADRDKAMADCLGRLGWRPRE